MTLILSRAFCLHADGRTLGPGVLSVPAAGGGFHIKVAGLVGERSYFAARRTRDAGATDDSGSDRDQIQAWLNSTRYLEHRDSHFKSGAIICGPKRTRSLPSMTSSSAARRCNERTTT
jgi:hypothetical protein